MRVLTVCDRHKLISTIDCADRESHPLDEELRGQLVSELEACLVDEELFALGGGQRRRIGVRMRHAARVGSLGGRHHGLISASRSGAEVPVARATSGAGAHSAM